MQQDQKLKSAARRMFGFTHAGCAFFDSPDGMESMCHPEMESNGWIHIQPGAYISVHSLPAVQSRK